MEPLNKHLKLCFPDQISLLEWTKRGCNCNWRLSNDRYELAKRLPDPPKDTTLILPENYDTRESQVETHAWCYLFFPSRDDYPKDLGAFRFGLVPTYGHINIPGVDGWFLVPKEDIVLTQVVFEI